MSASQPISMTPCFAAVEARGWDGIWFIISLYAFALPLLMISAGGVSSLAGIGLLILDLMHGGWLGRLLLRWQRRIGIPELLLGFATIALVILFLIVFHLLLMWSLSRMNSRIEL